MGGSATISRLRPAFTSCSPPSRLRMAAVAISVRGHSVLTAMPCPATPRPGPGWSSSCRTSPWCTPGARRATWGRGSAAARATGCAGSRRARGAAARAGEQERAAHVDVLHQVVLLRRQSGARERSITQALLTTMSMPPNARPRRRRRRATSSSLRTSPTIASAWPPAASICRRPCARCPRASGAACGLRQQRDVRAVGRARSAIASPMPRLPPQSGWSCPSGIARWRR